MWLSYQRAVLWLHNLMVFHVILNNKRKNVTPKKRRQRKWLHLDVNKIVNGKKIEKYDKFYIGKGR